MFTSLPGFREFYPEDCSIRNHIFRQWRRCAHAFAFSEYDAPVLEPLELYIEKSGEEIVGQLFNFVDKGERAVSLRPEMTPSLARMVAAKANALKRPVKWFSIGECYRYERQQKGRLRAFYQFNADILGEAGPEADAECIALAVQCLQSFGLKPGDVRVRLSDRTLWMLFLQLLGLSEAGAFAALGAIDKAERSSSAELESMMRKALDKVGDSREAAPLIAEIHGFRALNSLEAIETALSSRADEALRERLAQWRKLLGILDAMGMGDYVSVDMGIVRGLAYYTGFVFEVFQAEGTLRALAGGGRYDNLVKKLGGPDMPAVGFAMGDVTLRLLLEEKNMLPQYVQAAEIYVLATGEAEHREALRDAALLRAQGLSVDYAIKGNFNVGKQLKAASQSGASIAIIYGTDELARGGVNVRDMRAKEEAFVPRTQLLGRIQSLLRGGE